MIRSFRSKETEKVWKGIRSASLPGDIQEIARRKLRMLNNAIDLKDMAIPPANRLEKLKGVYKEYHSIRINDQWRIIFKWEKGHSSQVEIVNYH